MILFGRKPNDFGFQRRTISWTCFFWGSADHESVQDGRQTFFGLLYVYTEMQIVPDYLVRVGVCESLIAVDLIELGLMNG